ncbi:MAG: thioredoxin domain-containing protein, partial [Acidobacteriota bacterium]
PRPHLRPDFGRFKMFDKIMTPWLVLGATFLHLALLPPAHAEGPADVVATVDAQPITMAELEAHLSQPLAELEVQRRQLLEQGLGQLVEQRLLQRAAEAKGTTLESLVRDEITAKVSVDDAAVDAFFTANQARIRQPKEQVAGQIKVYLEQQEAQELRAALVSELRTQHKVKMVLEPQRVALPPAGRAPIRGAASAPVTLTIFSDFQCPGCRGIEPVIDSVREAYGEKLNVVFRQFPLTSIHPEAFQAAEAALCAGDQGKFWEMHASLFADQRSLARTDLDRRATELALDASAFGTCLDDGAKKTQVEDDMSLGRRIGVGGTPTIYINGRVVDLARVQGSPEAALSRLIDDELGRQQG